MSTDSRKCMLGGGGRGDSWRRPEKVFAKCVFQLLHCSCIMLVVALSWQRARSAASKLVGILKKWACSDAGTSVLQRWERVFSVIDGPMMLYIGV